MPYVITQRCCNDASCVSVCPVDCIRPTPGEPQFIDAEQLFIDPATCIDCGACAEECPVDAIFTEEDLPVSLGAFADANREYFDEHPIADDPPVPLPQPSKATGPLRVAVVGPAPLRVTRSPSCWTGPTPRSR
jgi:ferredoxin--NADP+ reductase